MAPLNERKRHWRLFGKLIQFTLCALHVPVAQWIERLVAVQKVTGSTPVGYTIVDMNGYRFDCLFSLHIFNCRVQFVSFIAVILVFP